RNRGRLRVRLVVVPPGVRRGAVGSAMGRLRHRRHRPARLEQLGVAVEVERPALVAANALAQAFPALAVAIDVAMLELYASPIRRLLDEAHLHLARALGIALNLPRRADVPREDDPLRRLVGEHARPLALAAVDAAVIHTPT